MTTLLTPPPTRGTITNTNPPAAPRCGLNDTGICCKESDTAHIERHHLDRAPSGHHPVGRPGIHPRVELGSGGHVAADANRPPHPSHGGDGVSGIKRGRHHGERASGEDRAVESGPRLCRSVGTPQHVRSAREAVIPVERVPPGRIGTPSGRRCSQPDRRIRVESHRQASRGEGRLLEWATSLCRHDLGNRHPGAN